MTDTVDKNWSDDLSDIILLKAIAKKFGKYTPSFYWKLELEFIESNNEIIINGKHYLIDELMQED